MDVVVTALAFLLFVGVFVLLLGRWRWEGKVSEFVGILAKAGEGSGPALVSFAELDGLPHPVQAYFRSVLREGRPTLRGATIRQEGEFLLNAEKGRWASFRATHHLSIRSPGFLWDARIRMAPGLSVFVRDGLVEGAGFMVASVLGLIRVASVEGGGEITEGALHRYLAEAVWCPTALLPSQGVRWEALDESTARATLTAADTSVSLEFRFAADGRVESVYTPRRAREVDGAFEPTPWQGRFWDYQDREGIGIPVMGEVAWLLPEGPQPYWRGRITEASFG